MPILHEHLTMSHYGDESVYSKNPEEFAGLVEKIQSVESLEGVLAAHVGLSVEDGKKYYLHHFLTADIPARERAMLAAHAYNAEFLVAVCENARQTHHDMRASQQGKSDERTLKHQLSAKRLLTDHNSIAHSDWTTEGSSSQLTAKYPSIRMGFIKAKEGTSSEVLDDCIKEFRSLPTQFPLLSQVSIGRSESAEYIGPQHYPENSVVDWDLGFVFSYKGAKDRRELDSDPEFEAFCKKWRTVLGDEYHTRDLDVQIAAV